MASITKRIRRDGKPSYDVEYIGSDGRKYSETKRTREEAKRRAAEIVTQLARGEWISPRQANVRFGDFAAEWLESTVHLKPSTRVSYELLLRRHVLPYFERAPLGRIQRADVQKWLAKLREKGMGAGSIRNAFRVLSKVLAEAERGRLIAHNPAQSVSLPRSERRTMHVLSPDEIRDVAESITPRFRALVFMAAYVGPRFGELAALKLEHLDLLRGVVHVRASLSEVKGKLYTVAPKTWQVRTVPLPRFLVKILEDHIAQYASGYVFTSPEGGPLRRNFYRRHFKPAVKRAGLAITFHDLRHTAASVGINNGASVLQVREMLGHSSATVTLDTYSHIWRSKDDQLRDMLDSIYQATERDALGRGS